MRSSVCVIVPTYNRSDLIGETLDSILQQTVAPDEVIVVDDASTDGTEEVVSAYLHRGVMYRKIANTGPLRARNLGLQITRCDRVAFCDSDDLWHPDFLQSAHELWRRAPGLVASYANFRIVRGGGWSRETKFDAAPPGFWRALRPVGQGLAVFDRPVAAQLIDFQPFFPSGMIVDRAAFLAMGGWDEGVTRIVGSDFATALRVAEHAPLGILQQPLVGIRKHGGNLSGNTEAMNLGNARILEYVLATRPSMRRFGDKIASSIACRRRDALASAFARHDLRAVREIYRLLPKTQLPAKVRLKATVASLPGPVSAIANDVALWLGSSRSALMTMMS